MPCDIFPISLNFSSVHEKCSALLRYIRLFVGPFSTKKDSALQNIVRAQPRQRVELNLFDRHTLESFSLGEGQLDEQSLRALGLQIDGDKEKERKKDREKKKNKVGCEHQFSLFFLLFPSPRSFLCNFVYPLLLHSRLPSLALLAQARTAYQKRAIWFGAIYSAATFGWSNSIISTSYTGPISSFHFKSSAAAVSSSADGCPS